MRRLKRAHLKARHGRRPPLARASHIERKPKKRCSARLPPTPRATLATRKDRIPQPLPCSIAPSALEESQGRIGFGQPAVSSDSVGSMETALSDLTSPHFASELLLWNIVRDSTIDIMHVFDCGVLRYALSWVTDVFCPADFTFPDLNVRKNAHDFGDVRVPDLERALGSSRGSCSIRINGAQMRAFAIARLRRAAFSLLSDLAFS